VTLVFVESAEMKLLLLLPLAASLGTVLADGEDPLVAAVDDECAADMPCALQATQLRAQRSQSEEIENIQELDGEAANTSDRQFANVSDETASDLDEVQEMHLGSIADGPEASYTKEELMALMALSRSEQHQHTNGTDEWGNSGPTQSFSYTKQCYSFTGGVCTSRICDYNRLSQCVSGKCVCPGGCAGADGRCYNAGNTLVASGFTMKNVKWPNYRMYFKRVSAFNQMGTSSMPSFSFMGSDRFDLYRVPGLFKGRALYFLASHKWPEYVLAIRATVGTAFSPFGTYTVKLKDSSAPWKPEDIMLRVCSMVSYGKPNEIRFGSAGATHTIWAYVHSGDWDVWGAMTSPGTGGKWIADPPIPAGSISPC